jgi:hypothetical protein
MGEFFIKLSGHFKFNLDWRDRIRNIHIRVELKMEEIQNQIEESRLRWSGHVKRMEKHRIRKDYWK